MAGIAEDWKQYTIRDKILLCSSILPLFISVLYMLYYLPVLGEWIFGYDTILGKYLFYNPEAGDSDAYGLFGTYDVETHTRHIIRPFWLLLSVLALSVYGFALFKTDEQITDLLKQPPEAGHAGHSAQSRTSTFMAVTAVSQLLIFSCLFIFGWLFELQFLSWFNWLEYSHWEVEKLRGLVQGYIESHLHEDVGWFGFTPLSYLFIPNLIATVALAYYTRIKNAEDNPEYPGTEEAPEKQSFGISAYGASKLKEAKDLLDSGIITEEEFQQIKDEYLQ